MGNSSSFVVTFLHLPFLRRNEERFAATRGSLCRRGARPPAGRGNCGHRRPRGLSPSVSPPPRLPAGCRQRGAGSGAQAAGRREPSPGASPARTETPDPDTSLLGRPRRVGNVNYRKMESSNSKLSLLPL